MKTMVLAAVLMMGCGGGGFEAGSPEMKAAAADDAGGDSDINSMGQTCPPGAGRPRDAAAAGPNGCVEDDDAENGNCGGIPAGRKYASVDCPAGVLPPAVPTLVCSRNQSVPICGWQGWCCQ
jgi:hypothetical protein